MRILTGWKEIAKHLQHGVRTVQRWELVGLPVHRPKLSTSGSTVIAFAEELDAWMEATPVRIDVIRDLQARISSLEKEIRDLKKQIANTERLDRNEQVRELARAMKDRATDMIRTTRKMRQESRNRRRTGSLSQ